MLNGFWWSSNSREKKGIRWHNWEAMCMSKSQGGLGFKNLHGFNLALLGKHLWNFILNPNSLVSRLYKARYFSDCHVLQASQGAGPSFIWAGLWKAKEAIKEGFRWVVGDGCNIDVYKDRWLRHKGDFSVCRGYEHESNNVKVNSLFIPGTRSWDVDYVRGMFNEEDEEAILATPVPRHQVLDRIVWHDAKNGEYTVRDGYRFWNNRNRPNIQINRSKGWNKIWNIQVPHKIRIFLWRLGRNNLPVRGALAKKGVNLHNVCPFCAREDETVKHIFFDCVFAQNCWEEVGMNVSLQADQTSSEWLLDMLCTQKMEVLSKLVSVLWGIWFFRNKVVWENKMVTAKVAVEWSFKLIQEWRQAKAKPVYAEVRKTTQTATWKPPQDGSFKLNVNASVFPNEDFFSVGLIMRDHTGGFIQGRTMKIAGKVSVLEAEATWVLKAFEWVHDLTFNNVDVETDSLL